jgi:hypothetical protein
LQSGAAEKVLGGCGNTLWEVMETARNDVATDSDPNGKAPCYLSKDRRSIGLEVYIQPTSQCTVQFMKITHFHSIIGMNAAVYRKDIPTRLVNKRHITNEYSSIY